MTVLDAVLLVLIPAFAWAGWRQGFVVSVLSFGGLLVGLVIGVQAVPRLLDGMEPGVGRSMLALALVLACGGLLQAVGTAAGRALRGGITGRISQRTDDVLGAVAAVAIYACALWIAATGASRATSLPIADEIGASRVLTWAQGIAPDQADAVVSAFADLLDDSGFPDVFAEGLEQIRPVDPPDPAVLAQPGIKEAEASLVKVVAQSDECSRGSEGSGFAVEADRVVTNAHVVAGADTVRVYRADGGEPLDAEVVLFDPEIDLAVLAVPDLGAPKLRLAPAATRGDPAVVAGFPEDGPLAAEPARIRSIVQASGKDIYNDADVTREVYALRATVRPGNSGGPLLAPNGRVYGVVFAASTRDDDTGYALTADEVAPQIVAGVRATEPVSTGRCLD